MMCLSGQALAVAEQLEEEKKTPQKFSELEVRLESVFTTMAGSKIGWNLKTEFRIQESKDEFMLSLVKLCSTANSDEGEDVSMKAIKLRFMNGISNEVRKSLYIFCNDPHAITVTYQQLSEHAREENMHVLESKYDEQSMNVLNIR